MIIGTANYAQKAVENKERSNHMAYCSGDYTANGTVAHTRARLAKAVLFCADEANMRRWQASQFLPMYAHGFLLNFAQAEIQRRNRSPPRERPRDTLPATPESVRVGHILYESMCKTLDVCCIFAFSLWKV